ncbi:hypothetical protein HAPAU_38740 [Halalkalicoccus paucihalophilus]|uniref:Uncharacterized protein n=1 Tax=Halalkalicoccus paucihalophilus TaxID=1008153 RepID=A0A151A830_9EURY|nr:hypothetical protein [Halalkalicoccus paucihalophilus]KYH23795.1 hypothetical protein HAPAU_38740 [Halalkalicoccus paucihalophilus]
MSDATDEMIGRVVRTVEYNTGNGASEAISAAQIRTHLCANSIYPVEAVNRAIATALERGDLVEKNGKYASASPDTYRKYL